MINEDRTPSTTTAADKTASSTATASPGIMRKMVASVRKYLPRHSKSDVEKVYKITKELGAGNFAVVKLAIKRDTNEKFAVKIINKALCAGKEDMIETEIAVLKKVKHPYIVGMTELATNLELTISPPTYANLIEFNEVNTDGASGFYPIGSTMGWGATVSGGGVSPRLRYSVTNMTEGETNCPSYASDEFSIATMICATSTANPQISPCTFDEGSPLIQTYGTAPTEKTIVVGVLSKRSPTCDGAVPSVFTRLSVYYAWLNRVAGTQIATPPAA